MNPIQTVKPGLPLYRHVLAGFVLKGSTLRAYCRRHSDDHCYARQVLLGDRDGPAAREFRQRLARAAGLTIRAGAIRLSNPIETSEAA